MSSVPVSKHVPGAKRGAGVGQFGSPFGLVLKYFFIAMVNALAIWAMPRMIDAKQWPFVISTILGVAVVDVVYLSKRRFLPGKYLVPGVLFMLVFVVYPVGYTMYTSFTNYGTGNIIAKAQAIATIEQNSIGATDNAKRYELQILGKGSFDGELAFLLTDTDGSVFLGTKDGLSSVAPADVVAEGSRKTVAGYSPLRAGDANRRKNEISAFKVKGPDGEIANDGFKSAFVKEQTRRYDAKTNTVTDSSTGTVYHERDGAFVSDTGERIDPGWRAVIGTANYQKIWKNKSVREPFIRVFIWTFVFAVLTVVMQFGLGLILALVFNVEKMRFKRLYRSLLLIPYALPSFMTSLVWRGMLNQQFGIINKSLNINAAWLDGQWLPYFSILLVGMWLGFPYWLLVCSGALTSIPADLKEAAFVDGATGFAAFRRVTFPLLLVAVAPALIASFAYNFNNFNLIYLLTEGRPAIPGSDAGRTDILISYMWKVAFGGSRGADYGFASALAVVNFVIVVGLTSVSFRQTKQFEEVR